MTHSASLPASANSSSTLIVIPVALSMKTDDNLVLDSQSVDPEKLRGTITEAANKAATAEAAGLPAATSPPHTGLRIVSSRQSTPSQTRMSERGFVEPHHSNVPRRTRTRGKGQSHMPIQAIRKNSSAAPTSGASPTSPSLPAPLILEPLPSEQGQEPEEEFEQPITPLDTPNPNATRMPAQLLSLRLPSSPKSAAYTGLPTSTPLPYTSALQPTASTGLPLASSVPHMPRSGLPQGIGLGFGTPLSSAAITPLRIATPLTPGSGRLPTRRRRAPVTRGPETATPTPVFQVQGMRGTSTGSEERVGLPLASVAQVPHGPPSYGAYLMRMRDEVSRERRAKRGLQRVGHMGDLEVGFLDGDGILGWDDMEDVPLDGLGAAAGKRLPVDDLYVLLAEVDSDSDSDFSDSGSGSSSNSEGMKVRVRNHQYVSRKRRENQTDKERRELRLALPVDRRALADGTCALMPSQLREACGFIWEVVKTPSRTTRIRNVRPYVRILAPRGRPEDAMAIAITHLAYGDALADQFTAQAVVGNNTIVEDNLDDANNVLMEDDNAPLPGAARLIAQTARAAGILTPNRAPLIMPGALIDAIVDVEAGSPSPALDATASEPRPAPPSLIGFIDSELDASYTPAHLLAMRLLDEGDWLARRRPGAQGQLPSSEDGILGAGRGLVGVVDTAHPALGGLFGVNLDGYSGDEDEEDEYDGDMDEEGSVGSIAGSSAGARVDSHSDSEGRDPLRNASDKGEIEERPGRTVAWHGVPMPPKFLELEDDGSLSRERAMLSAPVGLDRRRKGKSRSKSRAPRDPQSKSKSRARTRSRSQHPRGYQIEDDDAGEGDSTSLRRPRTSAARDMRRAARQARRVAEAEAYTGIADQWRGVLSYDGLAALARVLECAV